MSRIYRIAVLECDDTIEPVKVARGNYGDIFHDLFAEGLKTLGDENVALQVSPYDVVSTQRYPSLSEFDGLLISGSKHCAFRDDAWIVSLVDYVRGVLDNAEKPVVGICFGHQIIGRAMGAQVGLNPGGWEISVDQITLSQQGQDLFGISTVSLHQMHRDAVLEVPDGFTNLGSSLACEIQGLFKPGRVLTLQAHPEFDEFIMEKIVERRHDQGIFDDELFKAGMERAAGSHDGHLVARAIWRFFLSANTV